VGLPPQREFEGSALIVTSSNFCLRNTIQKNSIRPIMNISEAIPAFRPLPNRTNFVFLHIPPSVS
ncbi:MAG: hypothetical protein IJS41_04115, partial [Clostridia bacterium]|nr:hypothetical protein [Clostridia bacterium]